MEFIVISEEVILLVIHEVDANSTAGPDSFPAIVLNSSKRALYPSPRFSFRVSLQMAGCQAS